MFGTWMNVGTIILGGVLGLLFHRKTPGNLGQRILEGFGLFVVMVGLKGAMEGDSPILYIVSIILGALLGEILHLDQKLDGLTSTLEKRFSGQDSEGFKEGFIDTTILFCVGAMAIVGPLNNVLQGDPTLLYIKSALDGVTAFIFASAFGASVLLSAGSVLLYQGGITLLALGFRDFLSTESIQAMGVIGNLLVAGIGFNMLKLGKGRLNVVNLLPAVFMPLLLGPAMGLIEYVKEMF